MLNLKQLGSDACLSNNTLRAKGKVTDGCACTPARSEYTTDFQLRDSRNTFMGYKVNIHRKYLT